MTPFIMAWSLMGASGAIFCIAALGGPDALPAFAPFSIRGALRLLMACVVGGAGGYIGGWLVQGDNASVSSVNFSALGGVWGGALGAFLAPFTMFGLYHLLEYRLRKSGATRASLGWGLMGSAGWVTVLVAPLLGFVIGEHIGGALGSADLLLGNVVVPFTVGTFFSIVPLLFWLIGRADSCYVWTSDIPAQKPERDPGRVEAFSPRPIGE